MVRDTDMAGGGAKPGAPSSPKLQPKPTLVAFGLSGLQIFRCLPLSKPEGWSDWHQIKGRWRSCVVGASHQSSGLAFLFCRVFNAELAFPCIVLCADLRTTTQTYDCKELKFAMLSGLGNCCRQYCDRIVTAFFRCTVRFV
jgi:hypothetical protein